MRGISRAASIAHAAVRRGFASACAGATTEDCNLEVEREIEAHGARPAFKGYWPPRAPGPFPAAACICINEEVVHAPPSKRPLSAGDLLTIDVGVEAEGWFGDVADTFVVGPAAADHPAVVLRGALRAVVAGVVKACRAGGVWSDVTRAAQRVADERGVALLPRYSGHGIGRRLHEPPRAAFGIERGGDDDFRLWPGMVLTIEPIVVPRRTGVVTLADGWTVRTRDGSLACHAERVVAITRRGPRILGLRGPVARSRQGAGL